MPKKLLRKRRNEKKVSRKQKTKKNVNAKQINCKSLRETVTAKNVPWSCHLEKINAAGLSTTLGDAFPESIPEEAYHKVRLNEDQIPIVERMYKKHGTNYYKMFMDHKTNIYQWTQATCEKYVKGWCVEKSIPQRSMEAEMMSGRGIDLRKPADWKCRKKNVFGH